MSPGLFTPPHTPSTSSCRSSVTTPRIMSPDEVAPQAYFPTPVYQSQSSQPWTSISAASSSCYTPSQLLRQNHYSQSEIKMEIETSRTSHTLLAPLGDKFSSDCITIAAKKNNTLQIMADRWDQEKDCHFEWLVTLDKDADMSNVTANFTAGLLRVTVRRKLPAERSSASGGSYRVVAPSY
ncbi:hypothetical protein FRB99_006961 [Tulasnella sp. 403]|nr:hypothetical protein FRB99_006961 [Tulasnella sp. 403]